MNPAKAGASFGGRFMDSQIDTGAIQGQLEKIRAAILELQRMGGSIPCVYRNAARMEASLKMLELNITDLGFLKESS